MNWNEIISNRTPVRTKDSARFGYVADEYKDTFVVIEGKQCLMDMQFLKIKWMVMMVENYP